MYKEAINFHKIALPAFIFLCVLLFLTGCAESTTTYITQNCTIGDTKIECPDGTEINIIDNSDTVIVTRPKNKKCNKGKKHE